MVDRDKLWNDKDSKNYFNSRNQFTISNDNDFNRFHGNRKEAASKKWQEKVDADKWVKKLWKNKTQKF